MIQEIDVTIITLLVNTFAKRLVTSPFLAAEFVKQRFQKISKGSNLDGKIE